MDVSVRDVDEIVRFGRSLNGFMTDYPGSLQQVSTGASSDYTKARNCLNSLRTKVEKAKWELEVAKRNLESLETRACRRPEEDYTDRIIRQEEIVEQKQEIYERATRALEEGESIVKRIKANSDRVIEEVNRGRRLLQDQGHNALSTIKKAAAAISKYVS